MTRALRLITSHEVQSEVEDPRCEHRLLNPKVKQKPEFRTNLVGSPRNVRRYTTSYCQCNNLRDRFAKPVGKRRMPCDEFLFSVAPTDSAPNQQRSCRDCETRAIITLSHPWPQSDGNYKWLTHKIGEPGDCSRGSPWWHQDMAGTHFMHETDQTPREGRSGRYHQIPTTPPNLKTTLQPRVIEQHLMAVHSRCTRTLKTKGNKGKDARRSLKCK